MIHVLVRHKVKDHDAWMKVFNEFVATRKAGGEKSFLIAHPENDSNDLVLLFEWDSKQNADKFFSSSELQETMKNAGVLEQPKIEYLTESTRGKL